MAYEKDWFRNNVSAEISPAGCGCSFCCFRNLPREQYCDKLTCYAEWTDTYVYWESRYGNDMLMGKPPLKMVEWFEKTPDVDHISGQCANMIRIRNR